MNEDTADSPENLKKQAEFLDEIIIRKRVKLACVQTLQQKCKELWSQFDRIGLDTAVVGGMIEYVHDQMLEVKAEIFDDQEHLVDIQIRLAL
jgi:hypothetical protein